MPNRLGRTCRARVSAMRHYALSTQSRIGAELRGREHVSIGAGSAFLAVYGWQFLHGSTGFSVVIPACAAAAVGSLAPDLDHPSSLASLSIPVSLISCGSIFLVARWYDVAHPSAFPLGLSTLGPEWTLVARAAIAVGIVLLLLSWLLGGVFGHRGAFHSLAVGVLATLLALAGLLIFHGPWWCALAFAWGWLAHLLADATTPAGVPALWWPWARGMPDESA